MATNCSDNLYTVNFTDKRKDHILVSKGELITDQADIAFVGKTNRDYGEIFDENTLHLLENFACPEGLIENTPDLNTALGSLLENPVEGQVWYNTSTNHPFRYDGTKWVGMGSRCDVAGNYGVIAHGEALPQPVCSLTGKIYDYDECTWIVSPFNYPNNINYMRCATDEEAVVTMQYRVTGSSPLVPGLVNYQIIGISGNTNIGTGGTDPLPIDPTDPESTVPVVNSPTHTNVALTTATLGGNVAADGNSPITERGTVWGTSANPTGNANIVSGTLGIFTGPVTGLPSDTLIYYRAYATNAEGTAYSADNTFNTVAAATAPIVSNPTHSSVTNTTATLGGNVTSDGGDPIIQRGTVWATTPNPTIHQNVVSGTTGVFTGPVSGLPASTLIYYRAFATNGIGTGYSGDSSFSTQASAIPPTVINPTATSVTHNSATLGANVSSDGGAALSEVGIVWSTTDTTPDTGDNKEIDGTTSTGVFTVGVTGLPSDDTIYYRGYAINSEGTSYSSVDTIHTLSAAGPPVITEYNPPGYSNVTHNSATVWANVLSTGGSVVGWGRGAVWDVAPNYYPTIANGGNQVPTTGTTGIFSVGLTGLPSDTSIYFSLYAFNEHGIDYTNQTGTPINTGSPPTAPTVINPEYSDVDENSATMGAEVSSSGGYTVTERGIKWGTSPNPTGNTNSNGTGLGVFSESISGLPQGTLIYFRGYAINFAGTGYSEDNTFTTLDVPTVISPTHTGVDYDEAVLGATVSDNGGTSLIDRGVVWATHGNPTMTDNVEQNLGGEGVYTELITGLPDTTTIYYRGYAENSVGLAYSAINSFTTTIPPTPDIALDVNDGTWFNCHWLDGGSTCGTIGNNGHFINTSQCNQIRRWVEDPDDPRFDASDYNFTAVKDPIQYVPIGLISGPLSGNLGGNHTWCIPPAAGTGETESLAHIHITITGPAGTAAGTVHIILFSNTSD